MARQIDLTDLLPSDVTKTVYGVVNSLPVDITVDAPVVPTLASTKRETAVDVDMESVQCSSE